MDEFDMALSCVTGFRFTAARSHTEDLLKTVFPEIDISKLLPGNRYTPRSLPHFISAVKDARVTYIIHLSVEVNSRKAILYDTEVDLARYNKLPTTLRVPLVKTMIQSCAMTRQDLVLISGRDYQMKED